MIWHLYFSDRNLADVVPDERWPDMWRIRIGDRITDMVNLTRAKDALAAIRGAAA